RRERSLGQEQRDQQDSAERRPERGGRKRLVSALRESQAQDEDRRERRKGERERPGPLAIGVCAPRGLPNGPAPSEAPDTPGLSRRSIEGAHGQRPGEEGERQERSRDGAG